MEHPRAGDLFFRNAFWLKTKALRALPQHGALAGRLVDDDVRGLVRTILSRLDVIQVNPGSGQAFELYAATFVIAHCADVLHAQPNFAAATSALATCPPGLSISPSNGTLPA
jgi:hypothetical protein